MRLVAGCEADVSGAHRGELGLQVGRFGASPVERFLERHESLAGNRCEQGILVGEMAVERGAGDAQRGADAAQRQGADAGSSDGPDRLVDEALRRLP